MKKKIELKNKMNRIKKKIIINFFIAKRTKWFLCINTTIASHKSYRNKVIFYVCGFDQKKKTKPKPKKLYKKKLRNIETKPKNQPTKKKKNNIQNL